MGENRSARRLLSTIKQELALNSPHDPLGGRPTKTSRLVIKIHLIDLSTWILAALSFVFVSSVMNAIP